MPAREWRASVDCFTLLSLVCLLLLPAASARTKARKVVADAPEADTTGRVTDVRFWSLYDATRVAVEVTGEFEFRYDRLTSPDRIFFDISGVKPARVPKGTEKIPVGDQRVKQIRVAETQPGTTRIVLDLEGPVEAVASQLSNPSRLMIEVRVSDKSVSPLTAWANRYSNPSSAKSPEPAIETQAPPPVKLTVPKVELPAPAPNPVLERTTRAASAKLLAPPPFDGLVSTKPKEPAPATAAAARRNSSGERSMTRVLGLKLGRVVLDPGHGGHDGGTRGPGGLLEKDLVLDVAKRLGELIETRLSSEVVFTRDDDSFVPLEERTRIANRHRADLFLSIHANSSPARSASGIETYYLNFTESKSALEVAARENASSERSIYELRDLLQKIALKDKLEESREFASHVQTSLSTLAARTNASSRDRGVKKAPFVVLIGASMPSVLAEVGFVSNPHDENLMKRAEYRQKIAEALYKGIAQYAAGLSHFQVARQKSSE